jgi:superfamily II DNA or RNA helicase
VISVIVTPTIVRFEGLDPLRLNDTVMGAPEPAIEGIGLRSTTANLIWLLDQFTDANFIDPSGRLIEARAMRVVQDQRRPEPGDYERSFAFRKQPFPYQMNIFAAARHMTDIALAPVAMGTGKTKMTLDIAADKFLRDEIDGVLIIAPNGVQRQWIVSAIPDHLHAGVRRDAECAVWKPTRKTPTNIAVPNRLRDRYLRVLSFNVEAFSSSSGKAMIAARQFLASGRMMLVMDESSRIKNPKAARTKSIMLLRQYAKVRVILSGTPITKGLEDLFTQYQFLNPSIIGMSNFYAFRNRYCVTIPAFRGAAMGAVKITGYRNVEEFVNKIAPHSFVIPKDVLGLPEKTYERREVTMTAEQKKLYRALAKELVADLQEHRIATPANAAVRITRLQQVLCGRVVQEEQLDDETIQQVEEAIPSNRLEALLDVLNEYDGSAVIWCRFTNDIVEIKSLLESEGHEVVTYYGDTKEADRVEAVRRFREGTARYFIANPAAAGTGLDGLQVAGLAVYYSNAFAAEPRWQSEDRIHRIGMAGRAHYVDLVVPSTVDELILKNLKAKGDLAKAVFENPAALLPDDNDSQGDLL